MGPGSSTSEEHRSAETEDAGSNPARGLTYQYLIVRRELSGGALLSQLAHAAGESAVQYMLEHGGDFPGDTRVVVLVATKEELAALRYDLTDGAFPHCAIRETDGPLADVVTALGFVTQSRELIRSACPLLAQLKPWRA